MKKMTSMLRVHIPKSFDNIRSHFCFFFLTVLPLIKFVLKTVGPFYCPQLKSNCEFCITSPEERHFYVFSSIFTVFYRRHGCLLPWLLLCFAASVRWLICGQQHHCLKFMFKLLLLMLI